MTTRGEIAKRWSALETGLEKGGDLAPTATEMQAYRTVFYGGATAALDLVIRVFKSTDSIEDKVQALRNFQAELTEYFTPSN